MPISNYPGGFASGITIRGVPVQQLYPGETFWVNSTTVLAKGGVGSSDGNPGTYQKPLATITKAISLATANRGDVIICMPGHSETIITDGALAFSKAGVACIGLGSGTLRPKIVVDTDAAAAITVTAANVTLQNFVIEASFADITNAIDLTAANFSLIDCEFTEEGTDLNFLDYVNCSSTSNNNADGLRIEGCRGTAIDAAQNSFVNILADLDRLVFNDNYYSSTHVNTLAMILCATGKDLTDCEVMHNRMNTGATSGDLLINNDTTANEGIVAHNRVGHHDVATEVLVDCDGVRMFDNLGTARDVSPGFPLPVGAGPAGTAPLQQFISRTDVTTSMATQFDTGTTTLFTVTGDVLVYAVWLVVGSTAITSDSDLATYEIGTTGNTDAFQKNDVVASGDFAVNDVWSNAGHTPGQELEDGAIPVAVSGDGTDIILTIADQNTAGGLCDFYCVWAPVSAGAMVLGLTI